MDGSQIAVLVAVIVVILIATGSARRRGGGSAGDGPRDRPADDAAMIGSVIAVDTAIHAGDADDSGQGDGGDAGGGGAI